MSGPPHRLQSRFSRPVAVCLICLLLVSAGGVGVTGASTASDAARSQSSACSFPVTKTDATGTQVTINTEPQSIVTLAPSAAQTLWEIGSKDKVVGVSTQASYLDGASSLPSISTYPSVDIESVVDLQPDLVLAPNIISDDSVEKLRRAGLTVYKFEAANSITDVYTKTIVTGRLVGECDGAQKTVDWMREQIGAAKEAVEGKQRPRVFYHMGGGWTAGDNTFIHEIITTAGGDNIATRANIHFYRVMNSESIIVNDPEWIIRGSVPVPNSPPYSKTTAMQKDQIVVVNTNYINQPAPRIVYPIETIAEALHPDVEIEIDDSGGLNRDLTENDPVTSRSIADDDAVTLSVSNLYQQRHVTFDLSGDRAITDGSVAITRIAISLREPNPSFELAVRSRSDGPPAVLPGSSTVALSSFTVTPNGIWSDDMQRVTFEFTVPKRLLLDHRARPGSVSLYRRTGGRWQRLETSLVGQANETFSFAANASGTSTFAVGATATSVTVRDARFDRSRIDVGDSVTISATLVNPGPVEITYPVELTIGGTTTARRNVTIPANTTRSITLSRTVDTPGTFNVTLGSRSLGQLQVIGQRTTTAEAPLPQSTTAATSVTQERSTPTPTDAPTSTPATHTTRSPGQSGFGIGIVLIALVLAFAFARSREGS